MGSKKGKGKYCKGKKRKMVRENEPGPSHINLAYDSTDVESDMESEYLMMKNAVSIISSHQMRSD